MATTDVGPNDIIIHLVNPYKCSDCGSEFFMRSVFLEHLAEHVDKIKAQNPCYQIVCAVNLAAQQPNSITVTRDILQINDNQMFELQDTSIDYTQLTPLRVLQQAGILNLPAPQRMNNDKAYKIEDESQVPNDTTSQSTTLPTLSHSVLHQDLTRIQSTVDSPAHSNVLKVVHNAQENEISSATNPQILPAQAVGAGNLINSGNLGSIVPPSFIMSDGLKEELNVIIAAPHAPPVGHSQEEFGGIHQDPNENMQEVRAWGEADVEAIMSGKHIVLVKKVLKPEYGDSRNRRATCKICFNEFANKNVLMRHQVVHTGVKPHCCFTCFKEFNDISSLRKHLLIHKRSHRCPICLKMFLRRRQMELHLRQHNKKRFIQFGHKYHEVQVLTSRNEQEQIVHEFSLSALLNNGSNVNSTDAVLEKSNSSAADSLTPEVLTSFGNRQDDEVGNFLDQSPGNTENEQNSDKSESSEKKVIYKCGHCKKIINTRPTLSRHLMLHTNEKPFQCEKCGKQFRHKSDLFHHHKTHLKPVKCKTCGSAFSKRLHLKKHLEKGCPFLTEDSKKFTVLPDLTYRCNLCSKNLKTRMNVFRHMRVHAFEERKSQDSDTKKISKIVKGLQERVDGDDVSNAEDFIRPFTDSVGFQCTICEEEFRFKSFILIHVRMHLNQRPFKCKECGRGFFGKHLLKKHQQNHSQPYKCPKCGKGFNRRYLMTHHFSKNHSEGTEDKMKDITFLPDKKLLQCDICGKTMKSYQKSLMQYHVRLHRDVRPHVCKLCKKSFISEIALRKHMLNHNKPYICQVCSRGFSRRYLMLDHFEKTCGLKRISSQNKTGQAEALGEYLLAVTSHQDESLSLKSNSATGDGESATPGIPFEAEIVAEIDEHTGSEIFKCIPCDKTFTLKDALLRHLKTFTKQTPCKYCKTAFPNKHLTLAHQRSCLGVEIEVTESIKKACVVSHSQEKILKVMEEINQKIEHYTSSPQIAESSSEEKSVRGKTSDNESKVDLATTHIIDESSEEMNPESSTLIATKQRTLSALKKQSKYSCPECNKTFKTTRGLKIHVACHVRLYKCETCGQDFTQLKAFRGHLRSHTECETDEETSIERGCNEKKEAPPKVKEKPEKERESNSDTDSLIHKPDGIKIKGFSVMRSNESSSKTAASSSKCKDLVVRRQRDQLDVTARLMQSGTRGRPYSCKMCRRRFTEEESLISHMLQIHGLDNSDEN